MTQQVNNTPWNPTNGHLAELTGLPNLDNVTDPKRLTLLVITASTKLAGMLQQNKINRCKNRAANPLRYQVATKLYADRAAAKALA